MSSTSTFLKWKFIHRQQRKLHQYLFHNATTELSRASMTTERQEYSTEDIRGGARKPSAIRARFS